MLTDVQRTELQKIQFELRQPFSPRLHEIRDLPGGRNKWVFLKWQTIRDRLDEIYPEWLIDYSEIQYVGNDAICRCGITIMGIRKEALASVPISLISGKRREMTRGSAADRLAAEGLKNAAETWGVGRYLDDQAFTIKLMWDGMDEFSDSIKGEIRKLSEQYKINMGTRQTRNGSNVAATPPQSKKLAAKPLLSNQNDRIKDICLLINYPKELAREWLQKTGKTSFNDVTQLAVDNFVRDICRIWATQNGMNEYHAKNSYAKRVEGAIMDGVGELTAIINWMEYVRSLEGVVSEVEVR